MTTVLAALGPDSSTELALTTAAAVATLLDAEVVALIVGADRGDPNVDQTARAAGIEVRYVRGDAVEQTVRATQDPDVVALVVPLAGTDQQSEPLGLARLELISRVTKPVIIVPPAARSSRRIERILLPLEEDDGLPQALEDTIDLAREQELEILALHVLSPSKLPAYADHEPHATQAWGSEFLTRRLRAPHERVTLVRRVGRAAAEIVAASRELEADLVMLAWDRSLAPGRAKVVSETLATSRVPVLLLPRRTDAERDRAE